MTEEGWTRREVLAAAVVVGAAMLVPELPRVSEARPDPWALDELPLSGSAGDCSGCREA